MWLWKRLLYAVADLPKIEKWRKIIDEKGCAGAILMDFSKAFDTINHELLINYMHTVSVKRHFKFELLVK